MYSCGHVSYKKVIPIYYYYSPIEKYIVNFTSFPLNCLNIVCFVTDSNKLNPN